MICKAVSLQCKRTIGGRRGDVLVGSRQVLYLFQGFLLAVFLVVVAYELEEAAAEFAEETGMGGGDVEVLGGVCLEVVEGVVGDYSELVACGVAPGSSIGRDEGIAAASVGESSGGLDDHLAARAAALAEEGGEEVLGVESCGHGLAEHGGEGGEEVLLGDEGAGDERAYVAAPVDEERHARAGVEEAVLASAEASHGVVEGSGGTGSVLVAIVEDGSVV